MHLQRSSTLPTHGTGFDWDQLEEQVSSLNGLTRAIEESQRSSVTRSQIVRWQDLPTPTLVALAQAGHREAFDPLYRRYASRVFAYLLRKVSGDTDTAEDLAAETWGVALSCIDQWQNRDGADDDIVKWLIGIAKRRWLRTYADRWRERCTDATTIDDPREWATLGFVNIVEGPFDDDPDSARQQLLQQVETTLEQLPRIQRDVVRMRLDGADWQEIVNLTGQTVKQAKDAWRRGCVGLKERLADRVSVEELFRNPDAVRDAVKILPPVQQEVVRMRLAGMSQREIVRQTGRKEKSVASAWYDGQRFLRDWLSQQANAPQLSADHRACQEARQKDERARLRAHAESLPPAQRSVALMRLDGMALRDIVRVTGLPKGTVSSRWTRAKQSFLRHDLIAV